MEYALGVLVGITIIFLIVNFSRIVHEATFRVSSWKIRRIAKKHKNNPELHRSLSEVADRMLLLSKKDTESEE